MDAYDVAFIASIRRIEDVYRRYSRPIQIRIERWCARLSEECSNATWQQNRNELAALLLRMLEDNTLGAPFDRLPLEGPLEKLPPHLALSVHLKRPGLGSRTSVNPHRRIVDISPRKHLVSAAARLSAAEKHLPIRNGGTEEGSKMAPLLNAAAISATTQPTLALGCAGPRHVALAVTAPQSTLSAVPLSTTIAGDARSSTPNTPGGVSLISALKERVDNLSAELAAYRDNRVDSSGSGNGTLGSSRATDENGQAFTQQQQLNVAVDSLRTCMHAEIAELKRLLAVEQQQQHARVSPHASTVDVSDRRVNGGCRCCHCDFSHSCGGAHTCIRLCTSARGVCCSCGDTQQHACPGLPVRHHARASAVNETSTDGTSDDARGQSRIVPQRQQQSQPRSPIYSESRGATLRTRDPLARWNDVPLWKRRRALARALQGQIPGVYYPTTADTLNVIAEARLGQIPGTNYTPIISSGSVNTPSAVSSSPARERAPAPPISTSHSPSRTAATSTPKQIDVSSHRTAVLSGATASSKHPHFAPLFFAVSPATPAVPVDDINFGSGRSTPSASAAPVDDASFNDSDPRHRTPNFNFSLSLGQSSPPPTANVDTPHRCSASSSAASSPHGTSSLQQTVVSRSSIPLADSSASSPPHVATALRRQVPPLTDTSTSSPSLLPLEAIASLDKVSRHSVHSSAARGSKLAAAASRYLSSASRVRPPHLQSGTPQPQHHLLGAPLLQLDASIQYDEAEITDDEWRGQLDDDVDVFDSGTGLDRSASKSTATDDDTDGRGNAAAAVEMHTSVAVQSSTPSKAPVRNLPVSSSATSVPSQLSSAPATSTSVHAPSLSDYFASYIQRTAGGTHGSYAHFQRTAASGTHGSSANAAAAHSQRPALPRLVLSGAAAAVAMSAHSGTTASVIVRDAGGGVSKPPSTSSSNPLWKMLATHSHIA